MKYNEDYTTAYIGSATLAMKAQSALKENAIVSTVIKVPSSKIRRGCGYGVRFENIYINNVKIIFDKNGIIPKEYIGREINE